jgi:hypothetical protein
LRTKIFSSSLKNDLAYYNAGVEAVNSKVVGLAPVYCYNALDKHSPHFVVVVETFSNQSPHE